MVSHLANGKRLQTTLPQIILRTSHVGLRLLRMVRYMLPTTQTETFTIFSSSRKTAFFILLLCHKIKQFLSSLCPYQSSYATSSRFESSTPKSPIKFHKAKPILLEDRISSTSPNHARKTSCGVLFQQPHSPQCTPAPLLERSIHGL